MADQTNGTFLLLEKKPTSGNLAGQEIQAYVDLGCDLTDPVERLNYLINKYGAGVAVAAAVAQLKIKARTKMVSLAKAGLDANQIQDKMNSWDPTEIVQSPIGRKRSVEEVMDTSLDKELESKSEDEARQYLEALAAKIAEKMQGVGQ